MLWGELYFRDQHRSGILGPGQEIDCPFNFKNYGKLEFANHLKIPILIIVAEKEELMDNRLHGERVYNLVKSNVPAKYEVFSGTHFEIYGKGRMQSIKMAIEWFDRHL